MKQSVFIVYQGNQWLSWDSMEVKCICPTKEDAIKNVLKNHRMTWDDFPEYDKKPTKSDMAYEIRRELKLNSQTQGHSVNYLIEEFAMRKWI